jgi:hypothetical protein
MLTMVANSGSLLQFVVPIKEFAGDCFAGMAAALELGELVAGTPLTLPARARRSSLLP